VLIGVSAAASALSSVLYELGADPNIPVLMNQLAFAPVFVLVPLLILVFPSGNLASERWLPFARAAVGATAILTIWLAIRPVEYSMDNLDFHPNPSGVEALAFMDPWVMASLQLALAVFAGAALVSAIARYRRADAIGRLQVKWVIVPAFVTPVVFGFAAVVEIVEPDLWQLSNVLAMIAILFGVNGIAAGIGVAVTRHRLYGIDKIVSRTVTYTLLVGLLGLAFVRSRHRAHHFRDQRRAPGRRYLHSGGGSHVQPSQKASPARGQPEIQQIYISGRAGRRGFHRNAPRQRRPRCGGRRLGGVVEATMQPGAVGVWVNRTRLALHSLRTWPRNGPVSALWHK